MSCHVENEDSSHERGMSFVHPDYQKCPTQLCAETCCSEKRFTLSESSLLFGFLQNVKMTCSMMDGHEVLVCVGPFNGTSTFVVARVDKRRRVWRLVHP